MRRHNLTILISALGLILSPALALAAGYTVDLVGSNFSPSDIAIQVGDTVTWVNDGGENNVVADDGSFTSGPPSTDLWEFSHTFHKGGVVGYHNGGNGGMTGTVSVEGVFGDTLESGTTDAWSDVTPQMPNCDCYFSSDCAAPTGHCDWGSLTTEDSCTWRLNKPNGVVGAGCDEAYVGPWISGICDGICAPSRQGSTLGWEDPQLIEEGIRLWAAAILQPAEAGGGPVDPQLAAQAMALGFDASDAATNLGRQVADVLMVAGTPELYPHFCHFEGHPDDPNPELYVDLSGDICRASTAWLAIDALLAELAKPGTGAALLEGVPELCPEWQSMFEPRCPTGAGALSCLQQRIAETAIFLSTPRGSLDDQLQALFARPAASINPP